MATLTVRKVDEKIIRALKARAGLHGVSAEEEHRQILQNALSEKTTLPLKDLISNAPNWGDEEIFERGNQDERRRQI